MARVLSMLAILGLLAWSPATAQQSTYSKWSNPDAPAAGDKLQDFVDKLNTLIDRAEKARAADPNFLRDLRDLAASHNRPWQTRLFDDDFLDGNHTANPAWRVISGKYWVERGWGLRSSLDGSGASSGSAQGSDNLSSEERAAQIFGQILGQVLNKGQATQSAQAPAASGEAVIVSDARISNAFSLETEISSWSKEGRLHVAIYQGNFKGPATPGYRLAYSPGGGFELLRVSGRGTRTVERANGPYPLEDKKIHRIQWDRHGDGRMTVTVDDKKVFETLDRGFRDPFDGIALVNTGGDYIVKRVSVMGTK